MPRLDYPEWRDRNREALAALPGRTVMMFFSGGRDSSAVLHLLQPAAEEFGFGFEVHGGLFPRQVYTSQVTEELDRYWKGRGIDIHWHAVAESDAALRAALEAGTSPCLVCNTSKKQTLMQYIRAQRIDLDRLVVVLSYSLYDLVSASIEHILGSLLAERGATPALRYKPAEERFTETGQRFYPLLRMPTGFTVFKPLIFYNDQEIAGLLAAERIPVLPNSCEFKPFRPKRHFAQYYERMGLRFDYEAVFAFAKRALDLPAASAFTAMDPEHYLKKVI